MGLEMYWGKTNSKSWHPLLCHALDSASVAKAWSNSIHTRRSLGDGDNVDWALFFIYMHDYGKIDTRFQSFVPELWKRIQDISDADYKSEPDYPYFHGKYGYEKHFKDDFEITVEALDSLDFNQDALEWMAQAANHHDRKRKSSTRLIIVPSQNGVLENRDREARREFFEIGKKLFLENVELSHLIPIPNFAPSPFFEGFCSVCDWIASNDQFFNYENYPDSPSDYFYSRIELAEKALKKCGLISKKLTYGGMKFLFPDKKPRGVQNIEIPSTGSGELILIEAPTGSGKTEAALAIASERVASGKADSIIFALPTQATANAMFDRVQEIARCIFPGEANVVLAHGMDKFNEGFKILKEYGQRIIDNEEEDGAVLCSKWIASSKKRSMLGQICICTIDQVLLSVLPVRHNFVRRFALGRSVLIIDEVHSYSQYMNTLIEKVLSHQRDMYAATILLSATLPEIRRKEIFSTWLGHEWGNTPDKSYPLVSYAVRGEEKIDEIPLQEEESGSKRYVAIDLAMTDNALPDENLYREIIYTAEKGSTVVFICNLVDDAQKISGELRKRTNIPVDLFHARFMFYDRACIEREIIARYGKNRVSGEGRILVATQVVEQSLDLDFDRMFTQICPVDLLFQRIGRLHRHPLKRISSDIPQCTVLSPSADDFGHHALIYKCAAFLWRTRYLIENNTADVEFPEVYRKWIDAVYASVFEPETDEMRDAYSKWECEKSTDKDVADFLMGAEFLKEETAAAMTRDGEMSVQLLLLEDGKFSLPSNTDELSLHEEVQMRLISCPASWEKKYFKKLKRHDGIFVANAVCENDISTIRLNSATLHYTNQRGLWVG